MAKDMKTDVLVVGGGLAGLTLAGVLGRAGVRTVIVDRDPPARQLQENFDLRTTAISWASHRVLQAAGVWDAVLPHASPILDIRVADGSSPLFLHFAADHDGNGEPFGWIVENARLRHILYQNLSALESVTHIAPAAAAAFDVNDYRARVTLDDGRHIDAPLLVGADGRASATRQWLGIDARRIDYGQTAVVCTVSHERDHENVAIEHFLPGGPFAALPMTDDAQGRHRSSVVWSVHGGDAGAIAGLPPAAFNAELQRLFGPHIGRVEVVGKPVTYPLALMHAQSYTGPRTALMAEAAHVIHPIAGQGLNLSMRDIAVLAELVVDRLRLGLDIGGGEMLAQYEFLRKMDTRVMAGFTDVLNRLFSNDLASLTALRDLGLGIIEKIDPLKRFFARQAMGLGGASGRILRDGRL